jgi:serine/threonine protein kinase
MALTNGTKLGPYAIVGSLGAGGMGEVYRATQASLGRQVAIKILNQNANADGERLRRFELEARAASSLNHPNIVSIYDIGSTDGISYIAMEFVEGRTLSALLQAGPIGIKKSLQIAAQVAEGLAKAHDAGIVHRDLKPDNVMVTREGRVKVLDFGLAKLGPVLDSSSATVSRVMPAAHAATDPGTVLGTVGYMSPEQASGMPVDYRSDIFSLGSVLYEMLTGSQPFRAASSAQTMAAIIEDDPKPISELNPKVPPLLRWIVERCLAKDPDDRYASTRDLARDLARVRDHLSESGVTAALVPAARPAAARRLKIAVWLAAGVAIGALLAYFLLPRAEPRSVDLHTLTFSGSDRSPSISPDGRTVAFQSSRDGVSQIWLKQVESGSETALTSGPDDTLPRYSPDGAWILFIRARALYRVPVLGGDPRKLIDNVDEAGWSPDGRRMVFLRTELAGPTLNTSIGIASQDGSSQIIRRFQNEQLVGPSWSPDGNTMAFVIRRPGIQSLRLLSVDGKESRDLQCPMRGGGISAAAWTASGDELIYGLPDSLANTLINAVSSSSRILMQNVKSGNARVLFTVPAPVSRVEIAGSGRLIFDSLGQRSNLKELPLRRESGPTGRWLTHGTSVDSQPYYSSDAGSVVFSSSRSGDVDLWEVSTGNNSLRRLTDHPDVDWDPFITRDNKHLLWSSNRSGNFEVWMAERDGTAPRQITHDGYDAENPVVTADGWAIYGTNNPAHPGLWKVRLDGSEPSQIVTGSAAWPDLSPDSKYVLYHSVIGVEGRRHISVMRVTDGVRMNFDADGSRARFAPDGRSIIYIRNGQEIVSQPFPSSAEPVTVLVPSSPDNGIANFQVSPDGKHLAISYTEASHSLVMAEGVPGLAATARSR